MPAPAPVAAASAAALEDIGAPRGPRPRRFLPSRAQTGVGANMSASLRAPSGALKSTDILVSPNSVGET
jgi:hypothetical protein